MSDDVGTLREELQDCRAELAALRAEKERAEKSLLDKEWCIERIASDLKNAGIDLQWADGGGDKAPSGWHRNPFVNMDSLQTLRAELAAVRAERGITASPWRYREWGGLVVGGGEGSAEVLICTMATNTRHDEGRHNRELIVEAPTLRARLDKAEAEAARLLKALHEYGDHLHTCGASALDAVPNCTCGFLSALAQEGA